MNCFLFGDAVTFKVGRCALYEFFSDPAMSCVDSAFIKNRNRKFTRGLKNFAVKRLEASQCALPIQVLNSALPVETVVSKSQNLADKILSQLDAPVAESRKTGSHVIPHNPTLSSCYRSSVPYKLGLDGSRRRHTNHVTACDSVRTVTSPKVNRKNVSGRSVTSCKLPHPLQSGRMSQLANRVEMLLLQDPNSSESPPTVRSASASYIQHNTLNSVGSPSGLETSDLVDSKTATNGPAAPSLHNSPWYRYCRPQAPEPQPIASPSRPSFTPTPCVMPQLVESYYPYYMDRPTDAEMSSGDCRCGNPLEPHLCAEASINVNNLHLTALEMDTDQENRYWDSAFTLPPPPLPSLPQSSSVDVMTGDEVDCLCEVRCDQFPSPPPFLIAAANGESTAPFQTRLTVSANHLTFGPLSPITNILPNATLSGSRQPKWSATTFRSQTYAPGRSGSPSRLPTSFSTGTDSDCESPTSSLPSPPPHIVECVLSLGDPVLRPTELHVCPLALNAKLPALTNTHVSLTGLARPMVLKRGAPDGAEQQSSADYTVFESTDYNKLETESTAFSERSLTPMSYSPKKSRTHLLVPSEHSAFLPVGSARAFEHRVSSSPCTQ
ncbi:hypothetical protein EG68_06873 [Paragonimus skrjabini miyazakii]|uniref:Uncharacterized protein n=1 Tax=Paragonimus skrjabini miyazakii TaxID=59628 RepID=A0A8S9YQX5_9TREM|nr:hypothetical protein EG68_06873 [Paragonimus skrjabini miyazakii]